MEERKIKRKKEKAILEGKYEQIYFCCKELGDDHLKDEDNEAALMEYKEAEKAAEKLGNKLYIALTNRMIGETLCALGEFEQAVEHQKIHLEYSREEGNLIEEQRALATLGRTYFVQAEIFTESEVAERQKCLSLSHKYYLKSLNICERLPLSNQLNQKTFAEMKARLFLNLGLTCEGEGNTSTAVEYISNAIVICKNMELWEDLCRCYIAQGSIHFRQANSAQALAAYDHALQVVERLEKKIQISCELLSLKSDVLIMLSDFNGAKNVLIKAYKMKPPDPKDRTEIEEKLKTVVMICRSENKLLKTSETDYATRKAINEILGDCCVKLKNFKNAIHYYLSTLNCATALGLQGKDISPIYYSLSQTYKDDTQYKLSMEYSLKEYELIKDNSVEACKTLLNLADTMELMKKPFDKVIATYQECLSLAKKSGDLRAEYEVLKYMKQIQMNHGKEDLASETEKEIEVINCILPHSEDSSEPADVQVVDEDIDLDKLSDLCSEEENSFNLERPPRRRKPKASVTRRNEKGETPLHVASAKGNIKLIDNLVKQGHPINVPDAAGWSPLHEACNHGQIEAARLLIKLGAHIDDRGGPSCDGITPLLDAASNGHLELITLLLDEGASPLAKTNQGDTVLDCLLACRERAIVRGEKVDFETQTYFENVVKRLKDCYTKVGQNFTSIKRCNKRVVQKTSKLVSQSKDDDLSFVTQNRKCSETEITPCSSAGAAREYKDAIEALRRRHNKSAPFQGHMETEKKNALLMDAEVADDWLENDLAEMVKRPVKRRREEFVGQLLKHVKTPTSQKNTKSNSKSYTNLEEFDGSDDSDDSDEVLGQFEIPEPDDNFSPPCNSRSYERPRQRTKYQKSLHSMNFQSFNPLQAGIKKLPPAKDPVLVQPFPSVRSIKLQIEGKLFLIPVPQPEAELNIAWLIAEASRRYQKAEGITPLLNLSTEEGAMLDANDPISIILDANLICGAVVSWKMAPLTERYKEACSAETTDVDSYLEMKLEMCEATSCLEIKDRRMSSKILIPVLKAIQHYQGLYRVCLSAVFLRDQDFKALLDYLCKLKQVRYLDVSINNISNNGLSYLVQSVSTGFLKNLEELDLSYNSLGENCGHDLSIISQSLPYLRSLGLRSIGLTSECFYGSWNFVFDAVESLDISYNKLQREGISKFFATLNPSRIRELDISNTGGPEVMRECIFFLARGHLDNLETLRLSTLDADDEFVEQLVQSLHVASQLTVLDLSNNRRISVSSHKHLSTLSNLKELHLSGCSLLPATTELSLTFSHLSLSSNMSLNNFKESPYCYLTNKNE